MGTYRTTIYKYQIPKGPGLFSVWLPGGANLLHLALQNDIPCIWAKVNTEKQDTNISIHVYGTGDTIDPSLSYLGTYQEYQYVWHVFYKQTTF